MVPKILIISTHPFGFFTCNPLIWRGAAMKTAGLLMFFITSAFLALFFADTAFGGEKMQVIDLPQPKTAGEVSLEEAVNNRRSERQLLSQKLSLEQIGQLCWAGQGITGKRSGFRAAPSAGALYPLELYVLTEDGIYHYVPEGHKLEMVANQDRRRKLAKAAYGQDWVADAPLIFVISAVYKRTTIKYGARGRRYVDMEVGYVAENIHLQAVALGLGSTSVGAFFDADVGRLVNVARDENPLLIIPVGYAKK